MRPRFQADADLNHKIVLGLRRQESAVDFLDARQGRLTRMPDAEVIQKAAELGRILVSHDRRTMTAHFKRFVEAHSSPGLIIVPQNQDIGTVIEDLLIIWAASEADEWRNDVVYLPL